MCIRDRLIGDSGTGKSQMLSRFYGHDFCKSFTGSAGYTTKYKFKDIDEEYVQLRVQELSGISRRISLVRRDYGEALGAIIVYDCTNVESFRNVRVWLKKLKGNSRPDICKVLVGSKADYLDKKIKSRQGKLLAKEDVAKIGEYKSHDRNLM
eukprot:TRINITY_DN22579_c0_g1_i1.p1 TRINITY_DN22579_c0_g1~~TRINITY_DN22579_c0_g1_i1.p1  ORF type:complete len:152 (+),score=20.63 TRINITY_DN22579_c0_g1_i1:73-528(+)